MAEISRAKVQIGTGRLKMAIQGERNRAGVTINPEIRVVPGLRRVQIGVVRRGVKPEIASRYLKASSFAKGEELARGPREISRVGHPPAL